MNQVSSIVNTVIVAVTVYLCIFLSYGLPRNRSRDAALETPNIQIRCVMHEKLAMNVRAWQVAIGSSVMIKIVRGPRERQRALPLNLDAACSQTLKIPAVDGHSDVVNFGLKTIAPLQWTGLVNFGVIGFRLMRILIAVK